MRKLVSYSEKEDYFKDILKDIKKSKVKACYISFNKSSGFLKQEFKKQGIGVNDVFIIDVITKTISKKRPKAQKNVKFIAEPYRLDEISNEVKKAIKKGYSLIILDSISNLLAYYSILNEKVLLDFLNSFANEKSKPSLLFIVRRKEEIYPIVEAIYPIFKIYQKEILPIGLN